MSYFGEGQVGDQQLTHGNRAILRHALDGRDLRLFRVCKDEVEYLGRYELDPANPYQWEQSHQSGSRELRKAVVFQLRRLPEKE